MKMFKKAVLGAAMALAFSGAQASLINVGGVVWDPDSNLDFNGTTATLTQSINLANGTLSGLGVITFLNGTSNFAPGAELTFQYGGFTPVSGGLVPIAGQTGQVINYTGGWLNLYVDNTPNANPANPLALTVANTTDGLLWLALTGHAINGVTLTGINATANVLGNFIGSLIGTGQFDVAGGLAAGNLDTNTRQDGSDVSFGTSFTNLTYVPVPQVGVVPVFATGSGTFTGNSIPEPASLALVGLGLIGAGALRRRKAAK